MKRITKREKKRLAVVAFDTLMKFLGVSMFLIGLGGLAEVPTDPHIIVRALGLFIGGICMVAWNAHLLDGKESGNDRGKRR